MPVWLTMFVQNMLPWPRVVKKGFLSLHRQEEKKKKDKVLSYTVQNMNKYLNLLLEQPV